MKILKTFVYLLIGILLIIGVIKIASIANNKIVTVYNERNGTAYHHDSNYQMGDFLKMGDGEYEREEQKKEILTTALTYGGLIIGLLLFTTVLKNKEEEDNNLNSEVISGSYSAKPINEQKTTYSTVQNKIPKNNMESGIQYQKLAETANGCYLLLQDIKSEIRTGNEKPDHLLYVCYLVRSEILDRIEKFRWNLNTPIVVPMMPGENKTLQVVMNILTQNINTCAENISYYDECHEILRKDDFYYDFERKVPPHARSNF